jgi:hypothetical protein
MGLLLVSCAIGGVIALGTGVKLGMRHFKNRSEAKEAERGKEFDGSTLGGSEYKHQDV